MRKCVLLVALSGSLASATVTVSAPKNNSTVSSQVQFVATATTTCHAGVSAMGIYTAPGVLVYTVSGGSLNTLLNLNPGTYNTVVQEWDNCGGSTSTPVTIQVGSANGGQVFVNSPQSNSTVSPTVQFVASAT